jgi:hypothetical protein
MARRCEYKAACLTPSHVELQWLVSTANRTTLERIQPADRMRTHAQRSQRAAQRNQHMHTHDDETTSPVSSSNLATKCTVHAHTTSDITRRTSQYTQAHNTRAQHAHSTHTHTHTQTHTTASNS